MKSLLQSAIDQRKHLLDQSTNALRLVDGSGDDCPDLFLEVFAGNYLVSTRRDSALTPSLRQELSDWNATVYWKHLDQHQKESPEHLFGPRLDSPFTALENGIQYRIDFAAGYSQGIFLDQRLNRIRVREQSQPGQTVLNTFAYTGAFSLAAALGGATTTTLDLSQPYLDWAKKNFLLNGLDPTKHYFCKGDTFHWLQRFAKQCRRFNGIILDPPTFSRDKNGKTFSVEKDYARLLSLAFNCLADGGWILACTNCRKLPLPQFRKNLQQAGNRPNQLTSLAMPEEFTETPYLKSLWIT